MPTALLDRNPDPIILTARFDPTMANTLQGLRDRHFPVRRNIVPAHLTLFHHLPGVERPSIDDTLRRTCASQSPIPCAATGPRFLGRGVAIEIMAPALVACRRDLSVAWQAWLTAQDRQGFRPHVTVQNKVAPTDARGLFEALATSFCLIEGMITGIDLWIYRGGPWEFGEAYTFGSGTDADGQSGGEFGSTGE